MNEIIASHDGYLKKYNLIYEREIQFFPKISKLKGIERLNSKKIIPNIKFDIRFHLNPLEIMKTQDRKSILIQIETEGWRLLVKIIILTLIMVYISVIKIIILKIKTYLSLESLMKKILILNGN